ncbi:MAG: hypothetical protein F6K39_47035, partial [Okeania sp. SIO3B3]|nr:hypothetical protein [Okeania sp. SIO3B3]
MTTHINLSELRAKRLARHKAEQMERQQQVAQLRKQTQEFLKSVRADLEDNAFYLRDHLNAYRADLSADTIALRQSLQQAQRNLAAEQQANLEQTMSQLRRDIQDWLNQLKTDRQAIT